jgi:hypothetical protein
VDNHGIPGKWWGKLIAMFVTLLVSLEMWRSLDSYVGYFKAADLGSMADQRAVLFWARVDEPRPRRLASNAIDNTPFIGRNSPDNASSRVMQKAFEGRQPIVFFQFQHPKSDRQIQSWGPSFRTLAKGHIDRNPFPARPMQPAVRGGIYPGVIIPRSSLARFRIQVARLGRHNITVSCFII